MYAAFTFSKSAGPVWCLIRRSTGIDFSFGNATTIASLIARALRTAKHQQRKLPRLASLRWYFKKLSAHRIAGHFRFPAKVRQRLFERNGRAIHKPREHAVGPTR